MFSSISPRHEGKKKNIRISLFFSDFVLMVKGKTQKSQTYVKHKRWAHPHAALTQASLLPQLELHRRELFFLLIRSFQNHTSFLLKVFLFPSFAENRESFSSSSYFSKPGKSSNGKEWWESFLSFRLQTIIAGGDRGWRKLKVFFVFTFQQSLRSCEQITFASFSRRNPQFLSFQPSVQDRENNLFPLTSGVVEVGSKTKTGDMCCLCCWHISSWHF